MNETTIGTIQRARVAAMAGGGGPAVSPTQQGHVPMAINELESYIGTLADEISELENRISVFLRPTGPTGDTPGAPCAAPPMSHVADILGGHSMRLYGQILRLRALTARADV